MFLLRQLVHERSAFLRSRQAAVASTAEIEGEEVPTTSLQVEVSEQEFADRARQVSIPSVRAFLTSELFNAHRFTYDAGRRVIVCSI